MHDFIQIKNLVENYSVSNFIIHWWTSLWFKAKSVDPLSQRVTLFASTKESQVSFAVSSLEVPARYHSVQCILMLLQQHKAPHMAQRAGARERWIQNQEVFPPGSDGRFHAFPPRTRGCEIQDLLEHVCKTGCISRYF